MLVCGKPRGERLVFLFGPGVAEGSGEMIELLGGKGAALADMARLGLPVPPGLTITTEVCRAYYGAGRVLPDALAGEVGRALAAVGRMARAGFGDVDNPLLVSVRSGSRASMPGMMDTILNLGLNDETVKGLAQRAGDERFAYDSYRRFIQMYGNVVLGVDHSVFEDILDNFKNLYGFGLDTDLGPEEWRQIVDQYKEAIEDAVGRSFPQNLGEQLWGAIAAVLGSWHNARAVTYRQLHDIPDDWGTAVTVQTMVFGNRGETSATGVAFTRNPSTGANELYGEYLLNAQGEDVVSGIRTPQPLTMKARIESDSEAASLEELMPEAYAELLSIFARLEAHYRDMQDIEFTIQEGKVWMLQTRAGKRTAEAAIKIAADLCDEGLISEREAVMRVDPASLDQLLHPTIDPEARKQIIGTGLPASPGAAAGEIVLTADEAQAMRSQGREVILVRAETSPEDIHGMHAAVGVLTARGGMTSHAAVVARGMGRPCVSGVGTLRIDLAAETVTMGRVVLKKGEIITIDGGTGHVMRGRAAMRQPELSGAFGRLMGWADKVRRLGIRANADTPRDARLARDFGAEGIGLCRTEHMFFEEGRILAMREMVCAQTETARRAALAKILPMQRADFEALFEIMGDLPVTIRLLDPPLHEFLPHEGREAQGVADALKIPLERLKARVAELTEVNPMLGFRGCRLAIRYPEIPEMQARAIFEAVVALHRRSGQVIVPEIMIPLVATRAEFDIVARVIRGTAEAVRAETGGLLDFRLGTMIELPRSALAAGLIADGAEGAEFFSFGTNDLTQTCLGLSRDDGAPILQTYLERQVLYVDPFVSIDVEGVGELVGIGVTRGRAARPGLKIGICGEHGGDPRSVAFFDHVGLDYVSCSPYRVPVARLAAAQATIRAERGPLPPAA
jgi:pyruvate,orthophosphate dikinase